MYRRGWILQVVGQSLEGHRLAPPFLKIFLVGLMATIPLVGLEGHRSTIMVDLDLVASLEGHRSTIMVDLDLVVSLEGHRSTIMVDLDLVVSLMATISCPLLVGP
jgi:hypothetical protein